MNQDDASPPDLSGTVLVRRMGHDFNNLFSIVLGGLSLLREELPRSAWTPDSEETFDDVVSAAREATEVIAQLTAWAGRQALEPVPVDVNAVIDEAAGQARERHGSSIAIEVAPAPGAHVAWCDRARLRDAVVELLDNARDAAGDGGRIVLAAGSDETPWVEVADRGHGMDAQTLATCRQPFVTTRQALGRRGLGLSMVDGFARASDGTLTIDSDLQHGTRAILRLPSPPLTDA